MRHRRITSAHACCCCPMRTLTQPGPSNVWVWMAPSICVIPAHGSIQWMPLVTSPSGLPKEMITPMFWVSTGEYEATRTAMTATANATAEAKPAAALVSPFVSEAVMTATTATSARKMLNPNICSFPYLFVHPGSFARGILGCAGALDYEDDILVGGSRVIVERPYQRPPGRVVLGDVADDGVFQGTAGVGAGEAREKERAVEADAACGV